VAGYAFLAAIAHVPVGFPGPALYFLERDVKACCAKSSESIVEKTKN